jgi:amino acid adenylation domain-containing protein
VLVEELLERSAARFPDKTALVCDGRRLSYAQLEQQCNRLAHALIAEGVRPGDRVAIHLDNSFEVVLSVFAILKAGGVFLVVNPTTKPEKLAYILNNCRVRVLVTDLRKRDGMAGAAVPVPSLELTFVVGESAGSGSEAAPRSVALDPVLHAADRPGHAPAKRRIDIDLAALIYTSGSTGRPKGVMLTHLNVISAASSITSYLESVPSDVVLCVLPLSFDYGLYQAFLAFKVGATLVLERSFGYPHAVLETLIREKVTGFPIVPTMAAVLLQLDLRRYDLSGLRYITNTAAALPTHHIRRLRAHFPSVKLFSMYGLTECKRVSYLPPEQIDVRPASVGRGMPNEEVYLVNEQGERLGPGVVGQLVVRGSNVMKGYWELPEETDRVLKPGALPGERVLHTGDFFKMDDEGYLYFVGRKDDIIKTRGERVSPKEVEDVLHALDGVAEAAVVGIPDPVLGQAIKALVTRREGSPLTEQDLRRHCARHLEDFAVPKVVEFRESLPKTANGKLSKRALTALLEAEP